MRAVPALAPLVTAAALFGAASVAHAQGDAPPTDRPPAFAAAPEEAGLARRLAEGERMLTRGEAVAARDVLLAASSGPWACRGLSLLLLGRAQLAAGDPAAALASADASSAEAGAHRPEVPWLRADALAALGRPDAVDALVQLAAGQAPAQRRGRALVRAAELCAAAGQAARAATLWRRAALEHPATAPADALSRAETLAAAAGTPLPALSSTQRLELARALRAANLHERAIAELRRAEKGLRGGALVDAKVARARSHFDLRENDEARAACAEVLRLAAGTADAAECRLIAARAAWRVDDGAAVLAHVDAALGDTRLRRAEARPELWLVKGNLALEKGRHEDAVQAFTALLRESPASRRAGEARWRIAWCRLHQGRPGDAAAEFDRLVREQPGGELERIGRLWAAVARERAGDDATAAYQDLAARWPWSFQGEQARALLAARLPDAELGAARDAWEAAGAVEALPGPPPLVGDAGQRYVLLRDLGLHAWALPELEAFASGRTRDDALAFELARARARAGHASDAEALLRARFPAALQRPSRRMPAAFWEVVYPLPWAELVASTAKAHDIPAALCAAIIRSESGWDASARSWADARGLMQLIPPTAARLASAEGLAAFAPEQLFDPDVNVALGARHLADLLALFRGDLDAAIASYNAGEDKVGEWWRAFDASNVDPMERVERIPYRETRQYVRRVREAMDWYAWLMAQERAEGVRP